MNDKTRAALVEKYRLEGKTYSARRALQDAVDDAMKRMFFDNEGDYVVTVHKVADRAVPEPAAIERAAKAMYFTDANPDPVKYDRVSAWKKEWEKHLAFYQSEGYDPEGFFPAFMLAKKALAAVPTAQAAAGDDLDAMLKDARIVEVSDMDGEYALVRVPVVARMVSMGPVDIDNLKDAVQQASERKEATQ